MSCNDLCTAAKCRELEGRIEQLEQLVRDLTVSLQDHINMPVPYSHDYLPNFDVQTILSGNELITAVRIENRSDESRITLPDGVVPSVTCDIFSLDNGSHVIKVGVNGEFDEDTLTIEPEPLDFTITESNNNQYDFAITLGSQSITQSLDLNDLDNDIGLFDLDFGVNVSYLFNLLTVAVTVDGVTRFDTVYIDADIINRFGGGGGGGINLGGDDMGCQDIADALQLELGEILAAIAAVQTQVNNIQEIVTVEVEGQAITKFDCPKTDPDSGKETDAAQTEGYKLATLPALHEQLKYINENQLAMFKRICENSGVIALPAWWQTRLNASVPQIACVFRKGGSSTYHSISIPHPANTDKAKKPLLPDYTKGNYMGMVVCRDNSKFIINCVDKAEAERMCNKAVGLIDSRWLESPPRTSFSERKGQAVSVDSMLLTSMEYFESGQQNTIPNWRVRVSELE